MQSTETRFWLRFESGDQDHRRVPLPAGGGSVGRLEENEIVVSHSSVSGRHARFEVEEGRVRLVDLGSTNGLKVEGEKSESRLLAHGDRILLGRVAIVFEDEHVLGTPEMAPAATGPGSLGAELGSVRPEVVERSVGGGGRASGLRLGLILVLLGGTLAFAAWRFDLLGMVGLAGSSTESSVGSAVLSVPGNVLADPSFEDPAAPAWESSEAGLVSFNVGTPYARSGRSGLGVFLGAQEWAMAHSEPFELPARRAVELRAWLQVAGPALGRVGLEMFPESSAGVEGSGADVVPAFIAWAPAQGTEAGSEFREVVLSFDTLPGYRRGRVVVAGLADPTGTDGAELALDDLSVVIGDPGVGTNADFEEYQLRVLGSPGSTAVLLRSGRVLFSSLALSSWDASGCAGWARATWEARAMEKGFELAAQGPGGAQAPTGTRCYALPYGRRPLEREDSSEPTVMTVGPDGYREHALPFERQQASDLLAGGGVNLIRFALGEPGRAAASATPSGTRFALDFGGRTSLPIQLDFRDERAQAIALAARAREAEQNAQSGYAIQLWTELLDEHPFDAGLIDEAEGRRSQLEQAGLVRLKSIRLELERATFFDLTDLYRATLDEALAAAHDYAGSATEAECLALAQEIRGHVKELGARGASGRTTRLGGVLEALGGKKHPQLEARVRAELEQADGGD